MGLTMMTGFPRSGAAVETAFIRAIFYEINTARLFVSFANGRTYAYNNVPAAVHQAFQGALSPDMYFTLNIRDQYPVRTLLERRRVPGRMTL